MRDIVENGPAWFASQGRHDRKGLRSFSVSGRVQEPGVKLAPAGITVRELIDEYCGGMAAGHVFKGYLPGGASGGILPARMGDLPLDFGTLETSRLFHRLGGDCRPLRPGRHAGRGPQPHEVLRGRELRPMHPLPVRHGKSGSMLMASAPGTKRSLTELRDAMRDASICGLGQAAPNPLLCVQYFPEELHDL